MRSAVAMRDCRRTKAAYRRIPPPRGPTITARQSPSMRAFLSRSTVFIFGAALSGARFIAVCILPPPPAVTVRSPPCAALAAAGGEKIMSCCQRPMTATKHLPPGPPSNARRLSVCARRLRAGLSFPTYFATTPQYIPTTFHTSLVTLVPYFSLYPCQHLPPLTKDHEAWKTHTTAQTKANTYIYAKKKKKTATAHRPGLVSLSLSPSPSLR